MIENWKIENKKYISKMLKTDSYGFGALTGQAKKIYMDLKYIYNLELSYSEILETMVEQSRELKEDIASFDIKDDNSKKKTFKY